MKQLASYPSLRGKSVFITGGGSGIGETLVESFAAQGARVAFVDIQEAPSLALVDRIAAQGGVPAPLFRRCDLTDIASLQAVMAELASLQGDFDILVNNAANDQRHQISDVTVEYWDRGIAINQRPMFFAAQAVFDGMRKKGGGSIINVSSISWHVKNGGYPVYATAKSAAIGLTRALSRDMGAFNIRVNTVTPGWVMTQRQIDLWLDEEGEAEIKRAQCLPSKLMPHDIAAMVLFLGADDSAMCTAQEFIVDGGWV